MTMTAQLQADFGDTIEEYILQYGYDGAEWTVLVTAPELVSGITAHIAKDASTMEYDGVILSTGKLTEYGIAPISALPLIHEALSVGMLDSVWTEGDLVAGSFVYDDAVTVSVWFDGQGNPVAAELMEQGVVKVKCVLEDTEIKEASNEWTEEAYLGGNQPE